MGFSRSIPPAFRQTSLHGLILLTQPLGKRAQFSDPIGLNFIEPAVSLVPLPLSRLALLEEQRGNRTAALAYASEALRWSQRLEMARERALMEALCQRLNKADDTIDSLT